MKHLVRFFVVTFLLLVSTYASAEAEQKIVYLDMKHILNNSSAGKGAQDFLKKSFNENQEKFIDKEKELKKEENDLLAKKTILTKEEYQKKIDDLRKKVIDFRSQRKASIEKIPNIQYPASVLSKLEGGRFYLTRGTASELNDVIQHELPLTPQAMGGPLVNLQGKAMGINIARADRVTTFTLPATVAIKVAGELKKAAANNSQ